MKSFQKLFLVTLLGLFLGAGQAQAATLATYDFNNTSDLSTYFTSLSGSFTNVSNGGISDSGSVSVDTKSDLYGAKAALPKPAVGSGYTISGYFYNDGTGGYGGLGFMDGNAAVEAGGIVQTAASLGVYFHGGGGSFLNDGTIANSMTWDGGDLDNLQWYKMVLSLKRTAPTTYEMTIQIWIANPDGTLVGKKTERTLTGISSASFGSTINPYFLTDGSDRFVTVDNIVITDNTINGAPNDTTAPELVTIKSIPSKVKMNDAILVFRTDDSTCSINASPVSSNTDGPVALHINPLPLVYDNDTRAYLTGMKVGGTYSFSFNCVDQALNESNTITAGPFRIISDHQTSVGGQMSPESLAKAGVSIKPQNNPENRTCSTEQPLTFPVNIKLLQTRLLALGFNPGPIDGISGAMTTKAIRAAQVFFKIDTDGLVGPITRGLINNSCGSKTP